MLFEICAVLWCEVERPDICSMQRMSPNIYNEHVIAKEYRHLPMLINGSMEVFEQRLDKKLGCWAERISE